MIYDILPVNNYRGNGSAVQFDFDFYIDSASQLKVYLFDENSAKYELINNVDYTIEGIKNQNGGYITFPIEGSSYSILNEMQKISLELDIPASQDTHYNKSSLLNLESLEYSFDYLTRLVQILKRKLSLCVKVEECSDYTPSELMESISDFSARAVENAQVAQNSASVAIQNAIIAQEQAALATQKAQEAIEAVENASFKAIYWEESD